MRDDLHQHGLELAGDVPGGSRTLVLALVLALAAAAFAAGVAEVTGYALFGSADAYVTEQISECELAKERSRQYATALTALLNRQPITIGETTEVSCRVRHKEGA